MEEPTVQQLRSIDRFLFKVSIDPSVYTNKNRMVTLCGGTKLQDMTGGTIISDALVVFATYVTPVINRHVN